MLSGMKIIVGLFIYAIVPWNIKYLSKSLQLFFNSTRDYEVGHTLHQIPFSILTKWTYETKQEHM